MPKHKLLEYDTSRKIFLGPLCYELANLSSGIFHGGLYFQELWLALLKHVMGQALAQSAKLILGITVIGNV